MTPLFRDIRGTNVPPSPQQEKKYISIPRICQKNRRKSNVIITFPQMPLFTCRYISKLVCMYHKHILYISIYIYITIKHVYIQYILQVTYIYIYIMLYISQVITIYYMLYILYVIYIYYMLYIYIFNTPVNLIILHQPVFSFKKKTG